MDCDEARLHFVDRERGTLPAPLAAILDAHLAGCPACRADAAADRELSRALERLPHRRAPEGLVRALRARAEGAPRRRRTFAVGQTAAAMAVGAAIALVVAGMAATGWRARTADRAMWTEAVNDHLRVLYSQRPLEVESGDRHQVKPWFSGRLDFAPVMAFDGDDDFKLQGGAIGYFLDRKAATFVFKRRLHVTTLFVFPASGLHFPAFGAEAVGSDRGSLETLRGFHVLLWRDADLGYALVSDTAEADLRALAAKVMGR